MKKTLTKLLNALSLRQCQSQQTKTYCGVRESSRQKTLTDGFLGVVEDRDKTADTHSGLTLPCVQADGDKTPSVPYVPVKEKTCQAYFEIGDALRKHLCDNCDKHGRVKTEFGYGFCRRYRT